MNKFNEGVSPFPDTLLCDGSCSISDLIVPQLCVDVYKTFLNEPQFPLKMVGDWRKGKKSDQKSQTFLGSEIRSFKPTMAYRDIDVRAFSQLKANTCPFTPWVREIVREKNKKKKIIKN